VSLAPEDNRTGEERREKTLWLPVLLSVRRCTDGGQATRQDGVGKCVDAGGRRGALVGSPRRVSRLGESVCQQTRRHETGCQPTRPPPEIRTRRQGTGCRHNALHRNWLPHRKMGRPDEPVRLRVPGPTGLASVPSPGPVPTPNSGPGPPTPAPEPRPRPRSGDPFYPPERVCLGAGEVSPAGGRPRRPRPCRRTGDRPTGCRASPCIGHWLPHHKKAHHFGHGCVRSPGPPETPCPDRPGPVPTAGRDLGPPTPDLDPDPGPRFGPRFFRSGRVGAEPRPGAAQRNPRCNPPGTPRGGFVFFRLADLTCLS